MEDKLIHLKLSSSKYADDDDVETYFNRYEYNIYLSTGGKDVFIGKGVSILYLYEKVLSEDFDIIDVLDYNHHEEIYDILFDGDYVEGTQGFKCDWLDKICTTQSRNILISERLELLPAYRHKGYGKTIREILRSFFSGSYAIEFIHSFPLQLEPFDNEKDEWRRKMEYEKMGTDIKKAIASLNKAYKKDGYKRYKQTQYFYRLPPE